MKSGKLSFPSLRLLSYIKWRDTLYPIPITVIMRQLITEIGVGCKLCEQAMTSKSGTVLSRGGLATNKMD